MRCTASVATWTVCGLLLSWLAPWALLGLVLLVIGVAVRIDERDGG